jgi:hypothetical protein
VEAVGAEVAQHADRLEADREVLVDALAVELVGHAAQLQLAVNVLPYAPGIGYVP